MVTEELACTCAHPPAAAIVLVTVYVPGLLDARSICPVLALTKTKPPGEALNVPATPPPLNVGDGLAALEQYGLAV
jgi:hypothetical protein